LGTSVTKPKGEVWGEHELGRRFKSLCKKLGLEGWRFHDLRHFFVTELFRQKNSAPVVQRLAGHAVLITTQRYAHATREEARAAIESMGRGNIVVTGETDTEIPSLTSAKT
jgi:integrase